MSCSFESRLLRWDVEINPDNSENKLLKTCYYLAKDSFTRIFDAYFQVPSSPRCARCLLSGWWKSISNSLCYKKPFTCLWLLLTDSCR